LRGCGTGGRSREFWPPSRAWRTAPVRWAEDVARHLFKQFENPRLPPARRADEKTPPAAIGKAQMRKSNLARHRGDCHPHTPHTLRHLAQSPQPRNGNRQAVVLRQPHRQTTPPLMVAWRAPPRPQGQPAINVHRDGRPGQLARNSLEKIANTGHPLAEPRAPEGGANMRIACLGWGSLIWDPGSLPLRRNKPRWFTDGPELPIEFARKSSGGRITLVIVPRGKAKAQPVLWAHLTCLSVAQAHEALARRERRLRGDDPPPQD
jgi:hypothetical protein